VCAPPSTYPPCVHSPTALPRSFGPSAATHPDSFRPRGFSPPRRFAPLDRPRVCCAPKPNGVRCVSRNPHRAVGRSQPTWTRCPFPATRFTPLEEFPSSAAAPRHRGRCPHAVPAVRSRTVRRSARCDITPFRQAASRNRHAPRVVPAASRRAALRASTPDRNPTPSARSGPSHQMGMRSLPPTLPPWRAGLGPLSSPSKEEPVWTLGMPRHPPWRDPGSDAAAPVRAFHTGPRAPSRPKSTRVPGHGVAKTPRGDLQQRVHTSVDQTRVRHPFWDSPLEEAFLGGLPWSDKRRSRQPGFATSVPCGFRELPKRPLLPWPRRAAGRWVSIRWQGEPAPERRIPASGAADFKALLHRRVRSVVCRCRQPTPYPSMGFVPLRDPFSPLSFQHRAQGATLLRPSLLRSRAPSEPGSLPSQSVRRVRARLARLEIRGPLAGASPPISLGFSTSKSASDRTS